MPLLDQVRDATRFRHYSYQTELTYPGWVERSVRFLKGGGGWPHQRDVGAAGVERFLTHLAADRRVVAPPRTRRSTPSSSCTATSSRSTRAQSAPCGPSARAVVLPRAEVQAPAGEDRPADAGPGGVMRPPAYWWPGNTRPKSSGPRSLTRLISPATGSPPPSTLTGRSVGGVPIQSLR